MYSLQKKYPELAKEWHPEKNSVSPNEVAYGSKRRVWWLGSCGHEWESRVDQRTTNKSGCPFCRRHKIAGKLPDTHPHIANEWHPTLNTIPPSEFSAGQHRKVWWKGVCGHEWEASILNRCKPTRPAGCPICTNRKLHPDNSLSSLFPSIAAEWHPTKNGSVTPDDVIATAYTRVWWLAACQHEWQCQIHSRTRKNPTGCPICRESKGEKELEAAILELGLEYQKQVRFIDCRSKKPLPFDFQVISNDVPILIEFHGIQHYEPVRFGGTKKCVFRDLQARDKIKELWCKNTGRKLVVINYKDISNIRQIVHKEVCYPSQNS